MQKIKLAISSDYASREQITLNRNQKEKPSIIKIWADLSTAFKLSFFIM